MIDPHTESRVLASSVAKACIHGQRVRVQLEPGVVLTLRQGCTAAAVAWWAGAIAQSRRPIECVRRSTGTAWRTFRQLVNQAARDLDSVRSCDDLTEPPTKGYVRNVRTTAQ